MSRIMVIDDDRQLSKSFDKILSQEGYKVDIAFSGEEGLRRISENMPNLVILDIRLPGMNGIQTFQAIHDLNPKLPVIIITAYGTTETAIEAIKMGAFDYIYKPFEIPDMLNLIGKALETGKFMGSPVEVDPEPDQAIHEAIIGRSQNMLEVYKSIGRVASTDATVLIRGESGTGKELTARAIYQHSLRADKPFSVINCVAIPENLLESELFGYEKGAFTGAVHRRVGKIEQANKGTIFLDEIGDMPLSIQAKILRLLQERKIERLGGREVIPVDVRVIAATNKDLEEAVSKGNFREDLYYRLKVVSINLPPLRERPEDIKLLTEYLLSRFGQEMQIENPGITEEALNKLQKYHWPGNIRELANTLQKILIFNQGAPIKESEVSLGEESNHKARPESNQDIFISLRHWIRDYLNYQSGDKLYEKCLDQIASFIIKEALNLTGGNRSQAAKLLGLSRPTLHSKMEKYGLKIESSVNENDF